jgi:diacylglycerol kinase family enzyme
MKRAALIVNPFASAVTEERLAAVQDALAGVELDVLLTERPEHATALARGLGSVDALLVYGGDGLLNEVLNGVDGSIPIGILPGGRTNVVVRVLGLPTDPVDAARAARAGRAREVSLGRVNGRRFAFAAGIGFDAELVRRVDERGRRDDGRRPGDVAFAWEAAKLLARRRVRYEPALEVEGLGRAAFALVANADPYTYVSERPLRVAPEAQFELGLDLVAPKRVTAVSLPRFLGYAFRGDGQQNARDVLYAHDLDRIVVRCDRPLALQVDGEDLGDVTEAVFETERGAVSFLAAG